MKLTSKDNQNGTKIDANNHSKSKPKHVPNQIMAIIKNHVFLTGENMQIHNKNNGG